MFGSHKLSFTVLTVLAAFLPATAQSAVAQFTRIDYPFPIVGGVDGAVAWGDFDNDDDLDLIVAGSLNIDGGSQVNSELYRNASGTLTELSAGLYDSWRGDVAWGDYDRDGYLDLAIMGENGYGGINTRIFHSNSGIGTFTDILASLSGMENGKMAWGDINNDGDLDLAYAGYKSGGADGKVAMNDPSAFHGFSEVDQGMWNIQSGAVAWGDYDNDGWMDMAQTGIYNGQPVTKILKNCGGIFSLDRVVSLPGVYYGAAAAWGDYDNDGYLDLAVAGASTVGSPYNPVTTIYRNVGGSGFDDIGASLPGIYRCSLAWGDYDNDSDLDLAMSGLSNSGPLTRLYRNDGGGTFVDSGAAFHQFQRSDLAWGDYDKDGDLDLIITGQRNDYYGHSYLYRNDTTRQNTPPGRPTNLRITKDPLSITFWWDSATDAETPAQGLTYNVRVGTAPGKDDICGAMANPNTGYRKVVEIGNCQKRHSWTIRGVPNSISNTYYWSVQAVDTAFEGGPWAFEKTTTNIRYAKASSDDTAVVIGSAIMSASFADYFYIEEDDRSIGIRVKKVGYTAQVGKRVTVEGNVRTDSVTGERYILADSIMLSGTGTVRPLGMRVRDIGGVDTVPPEYTYGKQNGVRDGIGPNNIGLLIKVTGIAQEAGDRLYIDDGSGVVDPVGNPGVRVTGPGLPTHIDGRRVTVTGISSCYKECTELHRLILATEVALL